MYSIEFSKMAEKQFDDLERNVQERIVGKLERMKVRPFDFVKRLAGCSYYSMRVGDYRIILDIQHNRMIIFVIELGHRRNVYKKME